MNKKLLTLLAIFAVVAFTAVWASPRDSDATTWNPRFVGADFYTLLPSSLGAFSQTRAQFNVDPQSANFTGLFGGAITFGDGDVFVNNDAGVAATGASIGQLNTVAQLGLSNGACNTPVTVNFEFVEATTSNATIISPAGPSSNLLANFAEDDGDLNNDEQALLVAKVTNNTITVSNAANFDVGDTIGIGGVGTNPEFAAITAVNVATRTITVGGGGFPGIHNANDIVSTPDVLSFAFNGVADGADAYPSFINESLDPDGAGPDLPVTPRARYFATAFVANTLIVILQFVIFEPGQLATAGGQGFPSLGWANANWGYASTTFLQDPVAPPSNSAISDFCNFTSNTKFSGLTGDNACTPLIALSPPDCFGTGAGFTLRLSARNGCTQLQTDEVAGAGTGGNPIRVLNAERLNVGDTIRIGGTAPPPIGGGETKVIASVTPINPGAGNTEADITFATGLASARSAGALVDRTAPARTTIDECALVRAQNPGPNPCCGQPAFAGAGKSVRYYQYAVSQRDADNDGCQFAACDPAGAPGPAAGPGIENGLDSCPFTANPLWNPRALSNPTNNDSDSDGIPNGVNCDPGDGQCGGDPQDEENACDGWKNRLDQCPLVVDGNRTTSLTAPAAQGATSVTVANVTGFNAGDLINVTQAELHPPEPPQFFEDPVRRVTGIAGSVISFTPGLTNSYTTGGTTERPQAASVIQNQHASNTNQFDRDVAAGSAARDNGPQSDSIGASCDPNPTDINGHYHSTAASYTICIGAPPAPQNTDCTAADSDTPGAGDGIPNNADTCKTGNNGPNSNGPPAGFAQSLRDVNNDGFSDISDISAVGAGGTFNRLGGVPGAPPGYQGRLDLTFDSTIDVSDIAILGATFNRRCGPATIDP